MPDSQLWLMLVNSVSGENKTARMRIWRALKASGAAALRDGVYLLPKSESARAVFAEQAQEVVAAGGMAHIVAFDGEDDAQHREFVRLFDRSTDYAELFGRLDAFKTEIAKLDEVEARRQAAALRRDIAALGAIDFFPGASRHQVESALVHYLDVGGIPVPEAAGFAAIMAGARAQQANDDKLLHSMSAVLDALYASYSELPGGES